ncbi:hypothetical protein P8452_24164 [Trifolium repens]|nr:hypothetical protein P8452_24164 [Trifolium repens]
MPFIYFLPSKQYKYPIYLPNLCIIYFPELEPYWKSRAAALDRSIHIRRSSLEVEIRRRQWLTVGCGGGGFTDQLW